MIRVTFDRDYIDSLEDYYRRNECIREQQYLSHQKLLHLAAFCLSKAAADVNANGEAHHDQQRGEAALDAIGKLLPLCDRAQRADLAIEPTTCVTGQTNVERENHQQLTAPSATPAIVAKGRLRPVWAAMRSIMCAVAPGSQTTAKTPRS